PFYARSGFSVHYAYWPQPSAKTWNLLIDGQLLRQPAIWLGATVCGLLLLARRHDPFSLFIAIFVPLGVALATTESLELLHILKVGQQGGGALVLQLERIFFLIRPLGMIAAAYALVASAGTLSTPTQRAGPLLARGCVAATAALFAALPGARIPGWPA